MVGLICTGARVSRQDIFQEEDGGEQGGVDSAPALPLPQAPPGLAQVHGAILISLHSGASRHGCAASPRDTPTSLLLSQPCFSPTPVCSPVS